MAIDELAGISFVLEAQLSESHYATNFWLVGGQELHRQGSADTVSYRPEYGGNHRRSGRRVED